MAGRLSRISDRRIDSDATLFRNTVGVAFRAGASVAFGLFATGVAATPATAQAAGGSAGQLVLLQVLVAVFALAALSILVWAIRCRR